MRTKGNIKDDSSEHMERSWVLNGTADNELTPTRPTS